MVSIKLSVTVRVKLRVTDTVRLRVTVGMRQMQDMLINPWMPFMVVL